MHDLRHAIRALRTAPIVSAVAIVSLTLGIGANIAVFSIAMPAVALAPSWTLAGCEFQARQKCRRLIMV